MEIKEKCEFKYKMKSGEQITRRQFRIQHREKDKEYKAAIRENREYFCQRKAKEAEMAAQSSNHRKFIINSEAIIGLG